MSLIYDVHHFQQDFEQFINISDLSHRLLERIAFTQGSNSRSFITQDQLSEDMNRDKRSIKRALSSLERLHLLHVFRKKKNSPNPSYRIPDFLINYCKNHEAYVFDPDSLFKMLPKELVRHIKTNGYNLDNVKQKLQRVMHKTNKHRDKNVMEKDKHRDKNVIVPRQICHGGQKKHIDKTMNNNTNTDLPTALKEKLKLTNRLKEREKASAVIFSEEEKQEAIKRNIDIEHCYRKLILYKPNATRKDWEIWLERELPARKEISFGKPNELRSTVPWFSDNH